MTEETKEPLPSPELYNAELGQWLARQEGHAAAFARYDAFSQSLASGASDIPSRLHQLNELHECFSHLNILAGIAKSKHNIATKRGNSNFANIWVVAVDDNGLSALENISSHIAEIKETTSAYLHELNDLKTKVPFTSDDKQAFTIKILDYSRALTEAGTDFDYNLGLFSDALEEYESGQPKSLVEHSQQDRMLITLARYCRTKLLPELSNCVEKAEEAIAEHMSNSSAITQVDPSVSALPSAFLRDTGQKPALTVEGDGARVINLAERRVKAAETNTDKSSNER